MKTKILLATLLATSLNLTIANAQVRPDPFGPDPFDEGGGEHSADQKSNPESENISICYEAFSVPLAVAAALQRTQLADQALYAKLISSLEKNEATQEVFVVLRTRSGQKAKSESGQEMTYPSEYDPAQIANAVAHRLTERKTTDKNAAVVVNGEAAGMVAPATPCSFETRLAGFTLEVEPTLGKDEKLMDLRLLPEHVVFAGRSKYGQGVSEVESPEFEFQRITTSVTIKVDSPRFLGTMNPPPGSKVNPDSAKRVWFAFVTASLPE